MNGDILKQIAVLWIAFENIESSIYTETVGIHLHMDMQSTQLYLFFATGAVRNEI